MASTKKVVRRVKAATADTPKSAKPKQTSTPTVDAKVEVAPKAKVEKQASTKKSADKIAKAKAVTKATANRKTFILFRPFVAFGRYVRDSWRELRQVQWPSRRATWKMTLGVIIFCVFIGLLVLICDWASQWLIQEVIL